MSARYRAEVLAPREAEVGESPFWIPEEGGLLSWVDITTGRWHRTRLDGTPDVVVQTDGMLGAIVPAAGGWIAADASGFTRRRDDGGVESTLAVLDASTRMNDASCDSAGRMWAGSTAYDFAPRAGALHRLDADGIVTTMLEGLSQPNGMGWSPDGELFYLIDTVHRVLWEYAFDGDDGVLGSHRALVSWEDGRIADGLAVDADGGIWVALWGEGSIQRYTPEGTADAVVTLPVTQPASCAFLPGGRLVVTTARLYLGAAALALEPLAGSLFIADVGVPGVPVAGFGGWSG